MAHRQCKVDCTWSANLSYVIGLIASDGNLSPDGRHVNITSKDEELLLTAKSILGLSNKLTMKARSAGSEKIYYFLQFGDIHFYEFLISIGLHPAKSKTLGEVQVPIEFFPDFLRGCIDGDGNISEYQHPESIHPQLKISLCSASPVFIRWMLGHCKQMSGVSGGYINAGGKKGIESLCFGKSDSIAIMRSIYIDADAPALSRKRVMAQSFM